MLGGMEPCAKGNGERGKSKAQRAPGLCTQLAQPPVSTTQGQNSDIWVGFFFWIAAQEGK